MAEAALDMSNRYCPTKRQQHLEVERFVLVEGQNWTDCLEVAGNIILMRGGPALLKQLM